MPIRDFRCPNGHVHEKTFLGEQEPGSVPCPDCEAPARKVPSRFSGAVDKVSRERAFSSRGLIPYERGIAEDAERHMRYKEEALSARISDLCADVVRHDPTIPPD